MGFFGPDLAGSTGQIIFYLQLVVAIFLASHILLRKREPQICLGWLLAVALFPFIALIFYLGVGLNPFDRLSIRKRQSKALATIRLPRLPREQLLATNAQIFVEGQYTGFQRTGDWASQVAGQPIQTGNKIELLINSDAVYADMRREIGSAKKFILVQFYQIQADDVGFAFLDLLAEKAAQGVEVHVLFDALGSFGLKTHMLQNYRRKGVHINRFLEIHPLKRKFQINWRNHRKLVVIDGSVAFVGGFNIGRTYLQGSDPLRPTWVDLIFKVRGPVLSDLMRQFFEDWHFTTGKALSHIVEYLTNAEMRYESKSLLVAVPSGPSETSAPFYSTLHHILYEAKKRVWIMTPYFVPDKSLLHAMRLAVARGVHVRVIVPKASNHPFTDLCASSYFAEIFEYGIDLQRYLHGVCHGKVLLADDDLLFAGSSNMDYRSFFLNFETDLLIRDPAIGAQVESFMKQIVEQSVGLERADFTERPIGRLLLRRSMRLIAPLM